MVAQYTSGRVTPDQRFTKRNPCPICGGGDGDKRGRGIRCYGYLSADERYAFCTNSDYAGGLAQRGLDTYKHKLDGPCNCGDDHAAGYRVPPLRRKPSPEDAPKPPSRSHLTLGDPTAIHAYGESFRFLRYGSGKGKRLIWQHADGAGGWLDGRDGWTPRLYRQDEVRAADARKPVFWPEGEKCVDALVAVGAVALCNPDGAGPGKYASVAEIAREVLAGRHVVILADPDENGRPHAQAIADGLASVAASVRVLELEGAHDVADWLADGHTLLELLEITACTLPAQQSNPAMRDGRGTGTQENITCLNCARERELRRIAETSLANLRREQAMAARILALPTEQLTPPLKPAAIAVREVLSQPKARDVQGMELVYRRAISQRCGVSDQTAGTYLRKLAQAGVIRREVRKSFDSSEIFISEGPLFDAPEQIAPASSTWGGKRTKKGCPHCQSIDIEPTRYACHNCGAALAPDELIDVLVSAQAENEDAASPETMPSECKMDGGTVAEGEPDAQEATQGTAPPPDTILTHLASDAQDTPGAPLDAPTATPAAGDFADVAPGSPGPGENHRRERADVRRMAEALGWPRVQITQGAWTGGDPETWERFTVGNPPERIDAAYAALETLGRREAS